MFQGKHILIIVENLPVPFDTRVWQEACALKEYGARVSIICPKNDWYTKKKEVINGIRIYRHPQPFEANRLAGYLLEYSNALIWEFVLSMKVFLRGRFHAIHACNPPDLIFIVIVDTDKFISSNFIFRYCKCNFRTDGSASDDTKFHLSPPILKVESFFD